MVADGCDVGHLACNNGHYEWQVDNLSECNFWVSNWPCITTQCKNQKTVLEEVQVVEDKFDGKPVKIS